MAQGQLWTALLSAIDPINAKTMPAVLQSTIDLLESELANARAALKELQLQPQPQPNPHVSSAVVHGEFEHDGDGDGDDAAAAGIVAAYKSNLISRATTRHATAISPGTTAPVLHRPLPLTAPPSARRRTTAMGIRKRNPLLRLLSNSLVLDNLAPYLPPSSLLSLASTATDFRSVIMDTPYVFRYTDLRSCRGAQVASDAPIDCGGQLRRRERMDESLTEDDFYSVPLMGIFSDLQRRAILQDVRTLVLDGLPVPTDLVTEILTADRFNVTLLSIRECRHLNERKLMQTLQYIVRPTRPKGTPRVNGIYYFGPKDNPIAPSSEERPSDHASGAGGSLIKDTATVSLEHCHHDFTGRRWYEPTGRVLTGSRTDNNWAQTLQLCEGLISFDAVLCRSPTHNPSLYSPGNPNVPADPFLLPAVASIAVGSQGCAACGSAPEGPAVWDQSPDRFFPLLAPPPTHSSRTDAAKCPSVYPGEQPALILRCEACIGNRRCSRCKKWWCSACAPHSAAPPNHHNRAVQPSGVVHGNGHHPLHNFHISRDCWDCGPTVS